ncbi:MAG: hypothetical protein ACRC0L_09505, partial [Angustibacter sp.]
MLRAPTGPAAPVEPAATTGARAAAEPAASSEAGVATEPKPLSNSGQIGLFVGVLVGAVAAIAMII